jgi:antitoxin component YwqK of YwqJK toxin-antitoxin module
MKRSIILAGILSLLFACSSEKMNFNRLQDRNGIYYLANESKPYSGNVASYINGKVEFEGIVENGLRQGTWTYYYPNGQKKMEGTYKDGVKDGSWTYWKENGIQEGSETYKYGQRLGGTMTITEPDSTAKQSESTDPAKAEPSAVKKSEPTAVKAAEKPKPLVWERLHGGPVKYFEGVPYTGPVIKYWHGNGPLEFEGYLYRGKKTGKWTYYDIHGNLKNVRYY